MVRIIRFKKTYVFLAVIGILLAVAVPGQILVASSGKMVDTSKYAKPGPYKIGFSNISVFNSWRAQMVEELKYEASLHPEISALYITDANSSIAKQIADIEDLMAKGIDALLITPCSPDALIPAVAKVYRAGIPVIVFNSRLNGDQFTAFVSTDEVEFGYVIARWLLKEIGGKGNIAVLDGMAGNAISEERYQGLMKAIKELPDGGKNIKILAREPADWAYDKGKIAMEKILAAYPKIDGVWSQGGAMTQGAMEAFIAADRPLVPMTGEDNNGFLKLWKQLKPKGFKGIAASEPTWVSAEALKMALKALKGQPIPREYYIPVPTITDENLDKYLKPDLSDAFWANTHLPSEIITRLYKEKK